MGFFDFLGFLKGPGVLLKDPGVLLKDPGVLLKDPDSRNGLGADQPAGALQQFLGPGSRSKLGADQRPKQS